MPVSNVRIVVPGGTPLANGELGMDTQGRLGYYSAALGRLVLLPEPAEMPSFGYTGPLVVYTGQARYYFDYPVSYVSGRASVGTAPAGAGVVVDVRKNGTSIFPTTGNRPVISIGTNSGVSGPADTPAFAAGDYMTVDIVSIGTTTSGADLTFVPRMRRT